ncbi:hypothetical protein R1sor_009859 [Riccia sorocarpa]|uniref:Uncharacterized protein n=1 Tax=Riccia sorocarpa TaxID=122646 RepID=A0ABD3HWL3_9MARC
MEVGRVVKMEREYKPGEPLYYDGLLTDLEEMRIKQFHMLEARENQTRGFVFKEIEAPAECAWSFVRRFDRPQDYKEFLFDCVVMKGDGRQPGSVRHVIVKPELPGKDSLEELLILDEANRVLSFRILAGQHDLHSYKSVTSVVDRTLTNGKPGSLVVESYVVDVPDGNTAEQTNTLVKTVIRTHLITLGQLARSLKEEEAPACSKPQYRVRGVAARITRDNSDQAYSGVGTSPS